MPGHNTDKVIAVVNETKNLINEMLNPSSANSQPTTQPTATRSRPD